METLWLLCVRWNFGRVRWLFWGVGWWFHVVRWSGVVVRWLVFLSFIPLFGELGGFCGVIGTSVFAFVYIFRSVGGVLSGG